MKKIVMQLLLLCLLTNTNFAQIKTENGKKIDSLFALVQKITPAKPSEAFDSKLLKNKKVLINEKDLEKAKDFMYYAYAHAPLELRKKENDLFEEWKKSDFSELKSNERLKIVEEALVEKYGKDFVGFLKTPYFLRVQILEITTTIYPTPKKIRGKVSQINLVVKVIDILKGKEYYSKDDTITIAYLPMWFREEGVSPQFRIGEEYIVPLNHWEKHNNEILQIRLQGLHTLFQVKNNNVYSPLISETEVVKSWIDFEAEFKQKYLMEK